MRERVPEIYEGGKSVAVFYANDDEEAMELANCEKTVYCLGILAIKRVDWRGIVVVRHKNEVFRRVGAFISVNTSWFDEYDDDVFTIE